MKSYKINKGAHYYRGLHLFHPEINKSIVVADVCFSESCLYDLHSNDNNDINKIFGLSQGYHHHNSARFGWRCLDNKNIQIITYCYVNKVRLPEIILATVKPGETFRATLKILSDVYYFKIETLNTFKVSQVSRAKTTIFGYRLYPYFGGNMPAPHSMEIKLKFHE